MDTVCAMQNDRFSDAFWVPSPHFDSRPNHEISLIVIHGISLPPGLFSPLPVLSFFQGQLDHDSAPYFDQLNGLRVSSHLVIGTDGAMYQPVAFNHRAWHAGFSEFEGRSSCNDFSIGIELIGPEEGPFTGAQYGVLGDVCASLCSTYHISGENIVGHRDIASGRKVDPGADFDYSRVRPQN